MRASRPTSLIAILLCVSPLNQESLAQATADSKADYASDRVLLKFKSAAVSELAATPAAAALERLVAELHLPAGASLVEPRVSVLLRERAVAAGVGSAARVDFNRFLYLQLPPSLTVEQCLAHLRNHPSLEYVEPDFRGTCSTVTPNDLYFGSQWHHKNYAKPSAAIQTPAAWDFTQGSTNVTVAVLDTGLANGLPEFAGRTRAGYNFVSSTTNTADDNGHGTAVAGTLAATGNNGWLVAGVDWRCRLMPVKVANSAGSSFYSLWAQGIDFAVNNGAKIINLSAGGESFDSTVTAAIYNAIAHGVIFVTAAGNDGVGAISFPGNFPACITVGATDQQDRRTSFSNYGPQIDLVAPGANIYTVSTSGTLASWSGTSFSAPQVAGVCALMTALRPDLTHSQARALLCAGAEDGVGDATDTAGFDNYYGWGRLNAYNSLLLAQTRVDQTAALTNRQVRLAWSSPANASNKQPYRIDIATSLAGPWTSLNATNGFSYTTNRTTWVDDGSQTGTNFNARALWYRVRLVQN